MLIRRLCDASSWGFEDAKEAHIYALGGRESKGSIILHKVHQHKHAHRLKSICTRLQLAARLLIDSRRILSHHTFVSSPHTLPGSQVINSTLYSLVQANMLRNK